MGELKTGQVIITAHAVEEDLWRAFKTVMEETELPESKLAKYLIRRGLDSFEKDGKLGPYVFQTRGSAKHGRST